MSTVPELGSNSVSNTHLNQGEQTMADSIVTVIQAKKTSTKDIVLWALAYQNEDGTTEIMKRDIPVILRDGSPAIQTREEMSGVVSKNENGIGFDITKLLKSDSISRFTDKNNVERTFLWLAPGTELRFSAPEASVLL